MARGKLIEDGPPRRRAIMNEWPCKRYDFDGAPCDRTTSYVDRWCRECDGYATAEPSRGESVRPHFFPDEHPVSEVPDRADFVRVSRAARDQFLAHHPGSHPGTVFPQVRVMVRDILRGRVPTRASKGKWGAWALETLDPAAGYGVLLSPDGKVVIAYRTVHAERTYAQALEGVRSRVSLKGERRKARGIGKDLALLVASGELGEDEARLRALGHGHPLAAESFERRLAESRAVTAPDA